MASIHRRPGSKFYHAAFRDASGRLSLRSTKCIDRQKALAVALEFERTARRSESLTEEQARKVIGDLMVRIGGETIRNPTTASFLHEWLRAKKTVASDGTAERYRFAVDAFIASLGPRAQKPINAIDARDVQNFVGVRSESGVGPSTIAVDGKIIRTAFNAAKRQGLMSTNPVDQVQLPKSNGVVRGTFTPAEVAMLVEAAIGEWKTLIRLAYFTGARLSDCVDLEWDRVDFAKATISFRAQKTGKEMELPLHPELHAHLESIAGTDRPERFIMPGMAGKSAGGRHGLSESFKTIMRRAGIDMQQVKGGGVRMQNKRTFHSLRHSLVSGLANAGVSAELRMKITGHSSAKIHGGYTHLERETLRTAMAKLPGLSGK